MEFDKIGGHYYLANASYKFTPRLTVYLGYEHISGDDDSGDGKQCDFKQLFRGNHDFNGFMDYWNSPGKNGIQDVYGGLTLNFNKKKTSLDFYYHALQTAVKNESLSGKSLGNEIDFVLKHKVNPWFSLEGGYCNYFVNENVRIAKGLGGKETKNANWAYLSFSIKPSVMIAMDK